MEQVVLLDESGQAIGTHEKVSVHTTSTPLHLAFSCYVFDAENRLLVTQRALSKRTWPGVWTNTACGHPAPGESIATAVGRRLTDELGLAAFESLDVVLPRFRYRAVMGNGVVENEMCPVFRAFTTSSPQLDPEEVENAVWVPWAEFSDDVLAGRRDVSPWCVDQVKELALLDADPRRWHGDPALMPPAAREAA